VEERMTTPKFLGLGYERAEEQTFILVKGYRTACQCVLAGINE
jgi:hypothetical protein